VKRSDVRALTVDLVGEFFKVKSQDDDEVEVTQDSDTAEQGLARQ